MDWMLFEDLAFYSVLGLVAFSPLVVAWAAATGRSFESARREATKFLEDVATLAPEGFLGKTLHGLGVSAVLFLLSFVAYGANRIGDELAPQLERWLPHGREEIVRWSIEKTGDLSCSDLKFDLREIAAVDGDRAKWEEMKTGFGVLDVRVCRTMVVLALIGVVGGAWGVAFARRRRLFALRVVLFGLLAAYGAEWLWNEREANYLENLKSRFKSEYRQRHPDGPPSPWFAVYPFDGHWPPSR